MNNLDKLLKGTGVKPHKEDYQKTMDDNFGNPMDQLDDLFESLGRIFAPKLFHQDRFNNYKKAEDENNKKDQKEN